MLKQFKNWLANSRRFLFSWYTKDSKETQEPERSLIELPQEIQEQLVQKVEDLPTNPANQEAITSELKQVFHRWRQDPDNADNSLVVLSSPVTAVSRILSATIETWANQQQIAIQLLPWTARPDAIDSIKSKLEHYLEAKAISNNNNAENSKLEVVVIPNLSWCFLRSFEGLDGIEYLQTLLCNGSNHRFWIIGAGQVSWQYLNSVCNLEAYCGEIFALPEIAPEDLQMWLEPVITEMQLEFDKPRIDKQLLDSDKDHKTNYFERLASISKGVSTVAVQGFLKSISYEEPEADGNENANSQSPNLVAQYPRLPNLSGLAPADRYLLYSLLLHGDLTISTLAQSLGDEVSEVRARVQVLRRKGVVEQKNQTLKINPIYYPKLKQELASNNFIIHRD